jgi:NADH-quinone oxidoreductase chain G
LKYFYINNIKFNYDLEFNTNTENNNWKLNAPLIEFCETLGIVIPHFCYNKNLSISGNCRMCLVELKKSPKPIVSCAMNAKSTLSANTEIFTNSPLVKKARENVLEFLLLNHPLDCPICDQGGECDLQDQSLFFGLSKKRFYNFKRIVTDKNIGPIVKTVMTRCIHCTRCVRFASEIGGVEALGVFGRGMNTEIGTYVNKTFQSELSGNVIDLCPVGALTSKPYPFIGRSWELKNIGSIDFSDGFGQNTQVFLKNNRIVKILPDHNPESNSNEWISDKARFSFDGMFSPERQLNTFNSFSWNDLFKELIRTFYFYDHLNRHFLKLNNLILIFNGSVSIEVLNFLVLLSKKYSFIKLRRDTKFKVNNDFEANLQLNSATSAELLETSTLCLLIGINTRYEGSLLNQKLRQRYLKGNFKVFSVDSSVNLTFPTNYLNANLSTIRSIAEGNHMLCQSLKTSKKPSIIISSNIFSRNDASTILQCIKVLEQYSNIQTKSWNGLNILSQTLNDTGINFLNRFSVITFNDLQNFSCLFFLNSSLFERNLNKLIELKLLDYLNYGNNLIKTIIEQNNKIESKPLNKLKGKCNLYNYIYLPNNVFFESSGTFINTEGIIKKTVKLVSSKQNTRNDWQILRKLFSYSKEITFLSDIKINNKIQFNCNNLYNFKNFISFLFHCSQNLSKLSFYLLSKNQSFTLALNETKFKLNKKKMCNTRLKKNIDDFYIGGNNRYSKYSITMIECSTLFRAEQTNFNFIK